MVSMGCVDISGVEAATLALGLNTLTVARLCNTSITTIQLEALLRSVQYIQYSTVHDTVQSPPPGPSPTPGSSCWRWPSPSSALLWYSVSTPPST